MTTDTEMSFPSNAPANLSNATGPTATSPPNAIVALPEASDREPGAATLLHSGR